MSQKFYKKTTVGVAWCSVDKKKHKGIALSGNLIKKLIKENHADYDFPRLYAICIYLIIRNNVNYVKKMIICNDEPFLEVKECLSLLFLSDEVSSRPSIISISDYRIELGRKRMKSPADGLANSYRKRGLKSTQWNKGKKLNVVRVTYKEIVDKWNFIENSIKRKTR